jgi:hypothetical protein
MPEPKVKYMFEYEWVEGGVCGGGQSWGTVERDSWEEIMKAYKDMIRDESHRPYGLCLCVEIDLTEEDL